jgi:hypothetical protein
MRGVYELARIGYGCIAAAGLCSSVGRSGRIITTGHQYYDATDQRTAAKT